MIEIIIILLLIALNGIFAMAEIAIVSSRKSRLQQQAQEGNKNAQTALDLSNSPNRFLSTVQIGITFIGIFAGAFGGETIAESLKQYLENVPILAPYSEFLGIFIVVAVITYLSLVIGELVPKRLALNNPETIAKLIARPMNVLSSVTAPLVQVLSISTDSILRTFRVKPAKELLVSEEDIKLLIKEGARTGILNMAEKDIVERTFRLGDKKINTIMTPRKEIAWLDIDGTFKTIRNRIIKHPHSHFPVCRGNLDRVLGVIRTKDILVDFLEEEKIDINRILQKPIFIPETMEALKVLELFKKSGILMALIIDEYGSILGLITIADILEEIVGGIPDADDLEDQEIIKRDDGTFLIDGLVSVDEIREYFRIKKIPGERTGAFHTIGGFIMTKLGRIPVSGDKLDLDKFQLEVMDMDGNRVDKVLVTPISENTVT